MSNFLQEFSEYDNSLEKQAPTYSGLLGLGVGGSNQVNVQTRPGFVYVRLRDNLSEVIQVYNDKVSPIYDFPVLIQRSGNRWVVLGKDTNRYESWATPAPFLPAHAGQHSFNRDANQGGDAVFIYPDQFMPLLVYPSGTFGAGMLMIAPYVLQRTSDFIYVGNTGTQNLLVYKPTNNQAIMGLVVLNTDTGNPQVLIASGTPLAASITGTASVLPYVPQPASNQEALYAFRLVSGTNAIGWGNLYNARQLVGGGNGGGSPSSGINVWDEGVPDGSGITTLDFIGNNVDISVSGTVARVFVTGSSGGGSLPSFITGSIPFAGADGQLTENNPLLRWDETYRGMRLGRTSGFSILNFADTFPVGIAANNPNESVGIGGVAFGTGTLGSPSFTINGYRARGTGSSVIAPVQPGDALLSIIGAGYDGANFINGSRIRMYAEGNWITGAYTPTRMDFEVTPSGSTTRRTQLQVFGDSVNIPTGSTYNIGGVPHTHPEYSTGTSGGGREMLSSNRTYYVRTDGSDSNDGLTDSAGGAFLTAAKANAVVAAIDKNGYDITVQFGVGTWNEDIIINTGIGDGEVTWQGTLSLLEAVTSATVAAGSGATAGTVTKTGQFTGNAYASKIAYFQTDAVYRMILSNTNDALTLADIAASSTTQNVDVYEWGTKIRSLQTSFGSLVNLTYIELTGLTTPLGYSIEINPYTTVYITVCNLYTTFVNGGTIKECNDSYFNTTAASACIAVAYSGANAKFTRCLFRAANNSGQGVSCSRNGYVLIYGGTIEGDAGGGNKATYGFRVWGTAIGQTTTGFGNLKIRNCDTGLRADTIAGILTSSAVSYTNCTTNTDAVAAQYSYIN